MEDIGRRNLSFRETLCGGPSSDGGDSNNSSVSATRGGLGLLAAACGLSNVSTFEDAAPNWLSYDMTRLQRLFANRANSSDEEPKPCSERVYNTTNRQGK